MIDGQSLFDQPVKNDKRETITIRKLQVVITQLVFC